MDVAAHVLITPLADGPRLFRDYLTSVGEHASNLFMDPKAWYGVNWSVVAGFVEWMLQRGNTIGSINVRLSTIKVYTKQATKTGTLTLLVITHEQAQGLKHKQPQILQGRHDALLVYLLLDHGQRETKIATLCIEHLNLDIRTVRF